MNKKLLIPGIAAIIAIATMGIATNLQQDDVFVNKIEYIPSDISKEITGYELVGSSATYVTTDIKEFKDKVKMTIKGTIVSIGEPINWNDTTINLETKNYVPQPVKIPIEIQIDQVKKTKDFKKGDIVTFFLFGDRVENQIALEDGLNFESGEQVIVHIGEEFLPNEDSSTYNVVLGKYGKYTIQDDVAFNQKHNDGKSIKEALEEAQ